VIVVITDEAEADLESIGNYIAIDNPLRAGTFVQELVERCLQLAEMPRAYAFIPRYEHTGVRRRPHGEYLIFYRVSADRIAQTPVRLNCSHGIFHPPLQPIANCCGQQTARCAGIILRTANMID
jgi:plasmid stabilization system protein ParE